MRIDARFGTSVSAGYGWPRECSSLRWQQFFEGVRAQPDFISHRANDCAARRGGVKAVLSDKFDGGTAMRRPWPFGQYCRLPCAAQHLRSFVDADATGDIDVPAGELPAQLKPPGSVQNPKARMRTRGETQDGSTSTIAAIRRRKGGRSAGEDERSFTIGPKLEELSSPRR